MTKPTKLAKAKSANEGWPLVVFVGIFGLGLLGYLFSQFALGTQPHPLHWGITLVSAVLGGIGGWLWYRWRGDII